MNKVDLHEKVVIIFTYESKPEDEMSSMAWESSMESAHRMSELASRYARTSHVTDCVL
jgi:hypothetical protein